MNDNRLAELKDKYKDRNLLEELAWGVYANHSGYTSKQNGEFLNWLCLMAYKTIKGFEERPQGEYTIDELKKWLYEIVFNNYYNDFGKNCLEIIYRLDGFERFVADMREKEANDE